MKVNTLDSWWQRLHRSWQGISPFLQKETSPTSAQQPSGYSLSAEPLLTALQYQYSWTHRSKPKLQTVLSPINRSILHALHKWRTLKIKSAYLQRKHVLKKSAHLNDLICKFWIWIKLYSINPRQTNTCGQRTSQVNLTYTE